MRAGQASRTARQNALFRALEARRPADDRVADDPVAAAFLSPEFRLVAGAALGEGTVPMSEVDFAGDLAIVIGAEGEGIAPLVGRECDYRVSIPMAGKTQSLNASVAAAILLYEAVRQRQSS